MRSPFPGMNPYLERPTIWADFHDSLLMAIRQQLTAVLRPRYFVGVQHNVYIHEMPEEPPRRFFKPDVAIADRSPNLPFTDAGALLLEAPARTRIYHPIEEERVPYLAITNRDDDNVITVVEILSPSNKANGGDRDQYLAKRRSLLDSPANLIEIDLLRGGPKLPAEKFPACTYSVIISRPASRPEASVWPIQLRDRLPVIPIPLTPGASEPTIDLQELLQQVYDLSGFELITYRFPPEPPLTGDDAAWAEQILLSAKVDNH